MVLDKLWHDIINSHKVTKHACTFSCLPLATQYTTYIPSRYNNEQTTKQTKAINNSYIYINISCKYDTNRAGHLTLDAYASRPVACFNILRPRQNGRHFADAIFKRIFFNENVWISIKISLKFVPKGPINIITAMFQIMAWRRPGDKPLSGPMIVRLPTHICVTRPQWVNSLHQNRVTIPLNNGVNYSAPRYQVQNCHISHERFSHCSMFSELMMTSSNENIFRVTGHLCGEFTGQRWIPRTKASDAELWCFLWSVP